MLILLKEGKVIKKGRKFPIKILKTMKKIHSIIIISLLVFGISGFVSASMLLPLSEEGKLHTKAETSPVIEKTNNHFVLTPPGLEKVVFIHYKKGFGKPSWAGKDKKESSCYDFLGKGVKWQKTPVNYVIDPDNPDGLSEDFIANAVFAGAEEWDNHTNTELFNNSYQIVHDTSWDSDAPDGRNEILFGNYSDPDVIAVTVVWGYFSGPPSSRKISEFDILFDTDYNWGNADQNNDEVIDNPNVMDLQNIATHELGHAIGLGDVYDNTCSYVTMYGYSDYGEIQKRTIETPDIKGLQELYGE